MACWTSKLGLLRRKILLLPKRHFLSGNYESDSSWKSRLESPVFSAVKLDEFYFAIDKKFIREKRGSGVDVDIFANLVDSSSQIDQMEDLLHRFRRTPQSGAALNSTHHAAVRAYLKTGTTDNLLRVLDDPLNYGVFPEDYSIILILNHFLKSQNYRDALKTGIYMMLQEDPLRRPIASQMALYAAYKYITRTKTEDEVWDPQPPPPGPPEPEDEVKIRVKYLKPDYTDDHFDLRDPLKLQGKTLVKAAQFRGGSDIIRDTLEFVGYSLWDYDKMSSELLNKDISSQVKQVLKDILTEERYERIKFKESENIEDILKSEIEKSVRENESKYVSDIQEAHKQWNEDRELELKRQYELYLTENRKAEYARKRQELLDQEEELFFFDNFENMEMEKERKLIEWKKKLPKKVANPPFKTTTKAMSRLERQRAKEEQSNKS